MNKEHLRLLAKNVELVLMDCDGVLTDGKLYYGASGEIMKAFHVHDGYAIRKWNELGFRSGVITGRSSDIVTTRANELGISEIVQGSNDKVADATLIITGLNLTTDQVAYIGDDKPDIPLLHLVGFPAIVSNSLVGSSLETYFQCTKSGGNGAVREMIDFILASK